MTDLSRRFEKKPRHNIRTRQSPVWKEEVVRNSSFLGALDDATTRAMSTEDDHAILPRDPDSRYSPSPAFPAPSGTVVVPVSQEISSPFDDTVNWMQYRDSREFRKGNGRTVWYKTYGPYSVSRPPSSLQVSIDELYIHHDTHSGRDKLWVMSHDRTWVVVNAGDKLPSDPSRRLSIQRNGDPSWVLKETYSVYRTRRKNAHYMRGRP